MELLKTAKAGLEKKFQMVMRAPEGFGLFEAIHDFIEYIELTPAFVNSLSYREKMDRERRPPSKYGYLRQIYQGLEDVALKTSKDLGHARNVNVRDLGRIRNAERSENNVFWKKRALFRKLTGEIYEGLRADLDARVAS